MLTSRFVCCSLSLSFSFFNILNIVPCRFFHLADTNCSIKIAPIEIHHIIHIQCKLHTQTLNMIKNSPWPVYIPYNLLEFKFIRKCAGKKKAHTHHTHKEKKEYTFYFQTHFSFIVILNFITFFITWTNNLNNGNIYHFQALVHFHINCRCIRYIIYIKLREKMKNNS